MGSRCSVFLLLALVACSAPGTRSPGPSTPAEGEAAVRRVAILPPIVRLEAEDHGARMASILEEQVRKQHPDVEVIDSRQVRGTSVWTDSLLPTYRYDPATVRVIAEELDADYLIEAFVVVKESSAGLGGRGVGRLWSGRRGEILEESRRNGRNHFDSFSASSRGPMQETMESIGRPLIADLL